MVDEPGEQQDGQDEDHFEVVEFEGEDGEMEDWVILNNFNLEGKTYALLARLEEALAVTDLSEDELRENFGIESKAEILELMRVEGDDFYELDEDELKSVRSQIDTLIENRQEELDQESD